MKSLLRILLLCSISMLQTGVVFAQWTQVTSGLTSDRVVSLAINSAGDIFAGTYSHGLYRSTDNCKTWTNVITTSTAYEILSLYIDTHGYIYAGTYQGGLFRSTNNGDSWSLLSSSTGPYYYDEVYSVAVTQSSAILVVSGSGLTGYVYRSTDGGTNWTQVKNPYYGVVAVATNSAFFPVTTVGYIGGNQYNYYRSTDDGVTWTTPSGYGLNGSANCFVPTSISNVFASTYSNGVFKSNDAGLTWVAVNTGLTSSYINCLIDDYDATTQPFLYAGTDGKGVFYSDNSGGTWYSAGLGTMRILSLANNRWGNVFAGTYSQGLWYTGDLALPVEMASYKAAQSEKGVVVVWETKTEMQNAGFNILRKKSDESGYTMIASYISSPSLRGLGTSTTGQKYSFTDSKVEQGTVYDYEIEQVSQQGTNKIFGPLRVEMSVLPTEYAVSQNFPNPFNPSTIISYQLPVNSNVSLIVYDIIGRQVEILANGSQEAGKYHVTFDGSKYSSGVYYYRINAVGNDGQRFVSVKKLVLMK